MNEAKLSCDFDWKVLKSEDRDMTALGRPLASKILFLAMLIRGFEEKLLELKNGDCVWGPVHSSIGQEALAAASMAALGPADLITGSHRAHHQFIAKCFLYAVGDGWNPLADGVPAAGAEVLRRTLAEIMGLRDGYCGGRGGSMHLRNREAGVIGTNAIVGGGIPLATGAAYAERALSTGNVVVCFFGDGAVNQGSFHEALNLAGLWRLPVIYFVENNLYAVGTRADEACAVSDLSQRAAAYRMRGRIVDGDDVPAVYEAVGCAAREMGAGGGEPYLIEAKCYRRFHHAGDKPGSAYGYRSKQEEAAWRDRDALAVFPAVLERLGMLSAPELERMRAYVSRAVAEAAAACTEQGAARISVPSGLWPRRESVTEGVRSAGAELSGLDYREIDQFTDLHDMTYVQAIASVTGRWMEKDDRVTLFGEEIANLGGGAYGATKGLAARFPHRVVNTPISEAGFMGLACGAAMNGLHPVVEIMFPDFSLVAADQLFNQIGKARYMYGNTTELPLVFRTRIAIGCGYGGQHSMDPTALFALFPGWRVVAPSNAFDYIGLFNTAMHGRDPVLMVEHNSLYTRAFPVPAGTLDFCVPFGKARVLRAGTDVTVVGYGVMPGRLLQLAPDIEASGVSAEIIDMRTVDMPGIDYETIRASVEKTGALVIVEEAPRSQSIGPRIAAEVVRAAFDALDAPPVCLSSPDVPAPVSRVLEEAATIGMNDILEGILKGGRRT
jgi:2-oxoisovalerate dehydrogenase E1 component